jgi:acetyl-CoA C-acetyltransferase
MWAGHECVDVKYPWPHVFSELAGEYDRRYGLKAEHLARIAEINFGNARRNPNAQTRRWEFTDRSFQQDDVANTRHRRSYTQTRLRPNHRWSR